MMEGTSPEVGSVGSGTKGSSISSGSRTRNRKEFLHRFVDSDILIEELRNWFESMSGNPATKPPLFDVPFELIELQKFDYALEGISFQQLIRMPNAVYAANHDVAEATAFLAVEDFLHTSAKGLWEAFWGQDEFPFYAASLYRPNLKFYKAEKAVDDGKLGGLGATGLMLKNPRHPHGKWDHIVEMALLRPDLDSHQQPSITVLGEALFYALRMLISRSLSRLSFYTPPGGIDSIFILLIDSEHGGVVKVEGDISKLDFGVNNNNVYECASDWIKNHCRISVSPIDRIWNKLGNANWRDIGALQVLFATFHSIIQFAGMPKHSVEDLAADHGSRLQARRLEQEEVMEMAAKENGNGGLFHFQQRSASPEIIEELQEEECVRRVEESKEEEESSSSSSMKLEVGSVLWLDDSNFQKGYQINQVVVTSDGGGGGGGGGEVAHYIASPLGEGEAQALLYLYVGSPPSQLEPDWEHMNIWYQVQRQTKILSIMKEKGVSSKYLPQLSASGRIIHPGPCRRSSSSGNCDHPWCGTPILVTSPVGETVADMVNEGRFGPEDAIRCCHDCLSALSAAAGVGIRHGDIRPENVICVRSSSSPYYVLIGWGHAILEDRDRPAMNLHYSSTYALQEGKLCSASDAESLVYMLYFCCGGAFADVDSVEGALRWRETAWSRRVIQQKLGDVSTVLKAFTDYVDSLCGTPYPMDYDIWIRRLRRNILRQQEDNNNGKESIFV